MEQSDYAEMLYALIFLKWEVNTISLYDEEGVEGWVWTDNEGKDHDAIGDWNELPPWPNSAREALAKEKKIRGWQ